LGNDKRVPRGTAPQTTAKSPAAATTRSNSASTKSEYFRKSEKFQHADHKFPANNHQKWVIPPRKGTISARQSVRILDFLRPADRKTPTACILGRTLRSNRQTMLFASATHSPQDE
jgi:hypothetical protein